MSRRYRAGAALLLIITLESMTLGQAAKPLKGKAGNDKTPPAVSQLADVSLQARARQLIISTADNALKWDDDQPAIKVLSKAADLLWDDESGRARVWLTRAWEMSSKVKDKNGARSVVRMRGTARARARSEVLLVAQKHDAKFAKQLVDGLADEKEETEYNAQRGIFDDRTARSEQLLNLAMANIESNPAMAESLAERSLVDGISFQLQDILLKLRERDPKLADRLFDAALGVLATAFSQPSEAQLIASYLFSPGRVLAVDAQAKVSVSMNPSAPTPNIIPAQADPARARRFLTIIQQRLLNMPAPSTTQNSSAYAQDFIVLVKSLARAYNSYAPDLWPPLEQRLIQFAPDVAASARRSSSFERSRASDAANLSESERHSRYIDDLEETADKETDPIARKHTYLKAALNTTIEELERGRNIASKIEERELRDQVVSFLVYRAALDAVEKKHAEAAVSLASGVKPLQRAIILITAAQVISSEVPEGETEWQSGIRNLRALELLSEAEKILKGAADLIDALRIRLGLVVALARMDPQRAYSAMSEIVKLVNGMKSFDFMEASAPRITEIEDHTAQLLLPHIGNGYGIIDAFAAIAATDFDGSIEIANHITSPEGRGLSLFEIGRSALQTKTRKSPPGKAATSARSANAFSNSSRVRAFAARKAVLIFDQHCSMGLKSGE